MTLRLTASSLTTTKLVTISYPPKIAWKTSVFRQTACAHGKTLARRFVRQSCVGSQAFARRQRRILLRRGHSPATSERLENLYCSPAVSAGTRTPKPMWAEGDQELSCSKPLGPFFGSTGRAGRVRRPNAAGLSLRDHQTAVRRIVPRLGCARVLRSFRYRLIGWIGTFPGETGRRNPLLRQWESLRVGMPALRRGGGA